VALRPAISNWRTTETDVDAFVAAVRELGARVLADTRVSGRPELRTASGRS
jgi:hypothetical protein